MRHVFISPHLDDAVLSCGGYISFLSSQGQEIFIITVFSDFGHSKINPAARLYMWHCAALTRKQFHRKRLKEDREAMKILRCNYLHLGFIDAYFRGGYRNHRELFSGLVKPADKKLIDEIEKKILSLINKSDVLYGPMGLGGHVDHAIVNQVVKRLVAYKKFFWMDQPYISNLKKKAVLRYSSQPVCRRFANSPNLTEEYLTYG